MTNDEWDNEIWPVFAGLWPKQAAAFSSEEQGSYQRVVSNYQVGMVIEELRWLKDNKLFTPKPNEIRNRLSEVAKRDNQNTVVNEQGADPTITHCKALWISEQPAKADEIDEMTDEQVYTRYWCDLWNQAIQRRIGDGWPYWWNWQRMLRPGFDMEQLEDEYCKVLEGMGIDWSGELARRRKVREQVREQKRITE